MEDINDLMKIRREKLDKLYELDINPFAYRFDRTHNANEINSDFSTFEGKTVSIAGRLTALRGHGKAGFAHIVDASDKIQIYMRQDRMGEENFKLFKLLDIGDIIGVTGEVFKTRTEEITVLVYDLKIFGIERKICRYAGNRGRFYIEPDINREGLSQFHFKFSDLGRIGIGRTGVAKILIYYALC